MNNENRDLSGDSLSWNQLWKVIPILYNRSN